MNIKEQIERAHKAKRGLYSFTPEDYNENWRTLEKLNAVYEAAKRDLSDAKTNCGKYGGSRNCQAWIDRDLRCSDCPVEVWLGETHDAIAALQESE